jgi:hypothetical protein
VATETAAENCPNIVFEVQSIFFTHLAYDLLLNAWSVESLLLYALQKKLFPAASKVLYKFEDRFYGLTDVLSLLI